MKKIFLSILCVVFFISCNSELEHPLQSEDEYVEVGFNLLGDFIDINDKPMTKVQETDGKIYYYLAVIYPSEATSAHVQNVGHLGVFSDLKHARLRLRRGELCTIYATALIELNDKVDIDKLSKVEYHDEFDKVTIINILDNFSDYLKANMATGMENIVGDMTSPTYEHKNIDRYFVKKNHKAVSNENITLNLDRYSYALGFEIDAPSMGYIRLSCENPKLDYTVDENDTHLSVSNIYSLKGESLTNAPTDIVIKMEHYDKRNGSCDKQISKKIRVKPNVETTINIKYNQHDAENIFCLNLNKTPMQKEEVNF